jgi:RES domain-containing protein
VCRRPYAAFDGEGARLAGGRWNHRGVAVVYTSATLSLAALEYFVNLEFATAPADLVAVPAGIPDSVSRTEIGDAALPPGWRAYPAPDRLAHLGSAWAIANRSAVLVVPSAVIPTERNYVLNPGHSEFRAIRVGTAEPFAFDPRMWKE